MDKYEILILHIEKIQSDLKYVRQFVGTQDEVGLSLALNYMASIEASTSALRSGLEEF